MNSDICFYIVEVVQENRRKTGWNKPFYITYKDFTSAKLNMDCYHQYLDNGRQVKTRLFRTTGFEEVNYES